MNNIFEKIIVAVDVINFDEFQVSFSKTKDTFLWYKIHSIFLKEHRRIVDILRENGKKVFLDLKFFDIPATVEKHIMVISDFADMFTVHLLSGRDCLKRVVGVSFEKGVIPVGVSVLTSFSRDDLMDIGIVSDVIDEVLRLVELGVSEGITHFVCSPMEVDVIKNEFPNVKLITPGIRITGQVDDQKRVMTLKEALGKGVDWVVMGRDIMRLNDPKEILNYV